MILKWQEGILKYKVSIDFRKKAPGKPGALSRAVVRERSSTDLLITNWVSFVRPPLKRPHLSAPLFDRQGSPEED
jgi:hypothetical protein